jgi:hypothetical protein
MDFSTSMDSFMFTMQSAMPCNFQHFRTLTKVSYLHPRYCRRSGKCKIIQMLQLFPGWVAAGMRGCFGQVLTLIFVWARARSCGCLGT